MLMVTIKLTYVHVPTCRDESSILTDGHRLANVSTFGTLSWPTDGFITSYCMEVSQV
jgi:hypothetical protein